MTERSPMSKETFLCIAEAAGLDVNDSHMEDPLRVRAIGPAGPRGHR